MFLPGLSHAQHLLPCIAHICVYTSTTRSSAASVSHGHLCSVSPDKEIRHLFRPTALAVQQRISSRAYNDICNCPAESLFISVVLRCHESVIVHGAMDGFNVLSTGLVVTDIRYLVFHPNHLRKTFQWFKGLSCTYLMTHTPL